MTPSAPMDATLQRMGNLCSKPTIAVALAHGRASVSAHTSGSTGGAETDAICDARQRIRHRSVGLGSTGKPATRDVTRAGPCETLNREVTRPRWRLDEWNRVQRGA